MAMTESSPPQITTADLISLQGISDPQISPSGRVRACVVTAPPAHHPDLRHSDIWAAPRGFRLRPLTSGPGMKTAPRLSPDDRLIAYLSDADTPDHPTLHVLGLDGDVDRAPRRFADFPGVIEDVAWSTDCTQLLILAVDSSDGEGGLRGYRRLESAVHGPAGAQVHRRSDLWRRLYRFDLQSGEIVRVSPNGLSIWEFAWAGSGPIAAVASEVPHEDGWFAPRVVVIDPATTTARTVYEPQHQVQNLAISADAQRVAFAHAVQSDRNLLAGEITVIDVATGAVELPGHPGDVTALHWLSDGRLFWSGVIGVECGVGFVARDRDGEWSSETAWRGRATLGQAYRTLARCDDSGTNVVAAYQAHEMPAEFRELRLDEDEHPAAWRPLTAVNSHLAGQLSMQETVHRWVAGDGTEIEGLLLLPRHEQHRELPLVVVPHGGPSNVTTSMFASGAHHGDAILLAQAGCAVLMPNPRGSTGRGAAFTAANLGDLGGEDLADIEAGVDALIDSGLVDRRRVGIIGISYGGFMAAWAAVRSDRFVASIPIAGITDWLSFYNTSILRLFARTFLDGEPYDPNGPFLQRSPVMHVEGCRTATLVLHGEMDAACPVGQAVEFYNALTGADCESELVIYPRAGHGLHEADQIVDLSDRVLAWFGQHLDLARPGSPAGTSRTYLAP